MNKIELDLLVASELAECDRMLQWLEDDYNKPERIARRERIARHIGRPLFDDSSDMIRADSILAGEEQMDHVLVSERIERFRKIGSPVTLQAAGIMEVMRNE